MKQQYRAVVIGGGVVGASVLYHLAKFGWSEVALIERAELTAGSTWHAAAGFHALNADPNIAALQTYTIQLYKRLEEETGLSCGLHMIGGVNIASDPDRWEALKAGWAIFQTMGIETARLVDPEEARAICPVADMTGVKGGLYDENEGYLDPHGTTHAYAAAAKQHGAEVILRNRVVELIQKPGGGWTVVTEQGTIEAEHVVNAGGLWAKQVGLMAGVDLPVTPMEHHYLVTDRIPEIAALDFELPILVDLDGYTYMRPEAKGMLLGVYERNPRHWCEEGAPWDYGMELIPEDVERIAPELEKGFERYPCLADAGIKRWVNGAFTFTPDGNPLVGPVPGKPGYWTACGVMAGFSQGGGVGKALAEWMIHGAPEADVFGMDVARYGGLAANRRYLRETTAQFYARRFVMTYPNERLPAGRPLRRPAAYDAMTRSGARWTASYGLELPVYFAPDGFEERPTLKRSNAFDLVADEARAARDGAAIIDSAGFARWEVTGPTAEAWLDRLLACRLPGPGRVRLAPMLAPDGRLKGDMTVFNWGDGRWWLMASYYLRAFHGRWFEAHAMEGAEVRDISDDWAGIALMGPKARDVLAACADGPVDRESLPFMSCGALDVGLVRTKVGRLSVSGELGFELNCRSVEQAALREALLQAGAAHGLKEIGFYALNSLRLEKSFGIWSAEFTQGFTPAMVSLDRFVAADKGDFIGRDAFIQAGAPALTLVTLEIDAEDADASGFEPVYRDGARVGFVTSGGFGHSVAKSLAMALVDPAAAEAGAALTTFVVGVERAARVIPPAPHDPDGARDAVMTGAAARAEAGGTTRDDWFRAALETLIEDGVDRVKITALTAKLKASRSSFYWFYANRDAVLDALYAHWAAKNTPALVGRADAPAESLTAAVLGVLECWINDALFDVRLETAMRDWGRNDARVAEAVRAADLERIEALRRLFARHGTSPREDFARAHILYLNQTGYYTVGDVRDLEFRLSFLPEYMIVLTGRRAREAEVEAFIARARRVNGRNPKTGWPLREGEP